MKELKLAAFGVTELGAAELNACNGGEAEGLGGNFWFAIFTMVTEHWSEIKAGANDALKSQH